MRYRVFAIVFLLASFLPLAGTPAQPGGPTAYAAEEPVTEVVCAAPSAGVYLPLTQAAGSPSGQRNAAAAVGEGDDDHDEPVVEAPEPLGELVLTGALTTSFNMLNPPVTVALTCGRIQTSSVQVLLNGQPLPAEAVARSSTTLAFTPQLEEGPNSVAVMARDTRGALLQGSWTLWAGASTLDVTVVNAEGQRLSDVPVVLTLAQDEGVTAVVTSTNGLASFTNLPNRSLLLAAELPSGEVGSLNVLGDDVYATLTMRGPSDEPPSVIDNNDFSQGTEGWVLGDAQVTIEPHIEGTPPTPASVATKGRVATKAPHGALRATVATLPSATSAVTNDMDLVLATKGDGAQSIARTFSTKLGSTSATLRFRFITTEINGGYFGTQYDDSFTVLLRSRNTGQVTTLTNSMNGLGLSAFDQGGATEWFDVALPVSFGGDVIEVHVTVQNIGDGQLDSSLVLDHIIESNQPWANLTTKDQVLPAVSGSVLKLDMIAGLNGQTASYTYAWFRSTDYSDVNYQQITHTGATYTLVERDTGHRFYVRVADNAGNTAVSQVLAIGPSKTATPLYPINTNRPVRVSSPFVSFKNAKHDTLDLTAAYEYELQVASDSGFKTLVHSTRISGQEIADNHDVSYLRYPLVLPASADADHKQIFYWRVRPVVGGAPGRWSTTSASFYILEPWSERGLTWHDPITEVEHDQLRVTGTFNEGYHGGDLGTHLHGGLDYGAVAKDNTPLCDRPIYAVRGGVLKRVQTNSVRTITLHHDDAVNDADRRTRYLHMNHTTNTPLTRGIYLNQGAELGTMSNQPGGYACHLHLDLTSGDEDTLYNPLTVLSWTDTFTPTIPNSYIRSDNLLTSSNTGIITNVHFIARVEDRVPPTASKTAPHRLEFYIDNQLQCQTVNGRQLCTIQFDELTAGMHEHDFYAFNDAAHDGLNSAGGNVSNAVENRLTAHDGYLMFYRWVPPTNRAEDAGALQVRMRASDYYGNASERSMTIGPELTTTEQSISVSACAATPHKVTVKLKNANTGISNRTADVTAGQLQTDLFTLTETHTTGITIGATLNNQTVRLADQDRTATGYAKEKTYELAIKATTSGTIRVVASSGTLPFVKDAVTINVNVTTTGCP